jgi:hypothetical protein
LGDGSSGENLFAGFRQSAIDYFRQRNISWHGGTGTPMGPRLPSRHLCCSQSMCVNTLFALMEAPASLSALLHDLGYPVLEPLRFNPGGAYFIEPGYVAFEWIGLRNYLCEKSRGGIAPEVQRTRGSGFTSADFAFRFKRTDHRIQIVLGEWKYTEMYSSESIRVSGHGTDRFEIYRAALKAADCPIDYHTVGVDALFYEPFDQMMRLQLLAHAMERARELNADIVSVLHIVPSANRDLLDTITSTKLKPLGRTIHDVWRAMVDDRNFSAVHAEYVLAHLLEDIPDQRWADYMRVRYAPMK